MKIYCELCKKVQPVRIDNCRDAKTNEPYQDIVCAECDLVIASGTDIAQPEQEPVAWYYKDQHQVWQISFVEPIGFENKPLYTAPPKREWVGLTDAEAWGVYRTHGLSFHRPNHVEEYEWALCMRDFARDIEAKLKEKNS